MDYTTPPHSRAPTDAHTSDPHHITPIQTGSSSNYEKNAPRARTGYAASTPVTMRGEYGEAAHLLGMSSANVNSPVIGHGTASADGGAAEQRTSEAHSRAHGGPTPNFDFGAAIGSLSGADEKKKMLSQPPALGPGAVGRSIVWKVGKGVKRGDLPFMLVFIAYVPSALPNDTAQLTYRCLVIFLSALSGIGYVDPDAVVPEGGSDAPIFQPGKPIAPVLLSSSDEDVTEARRAWEAEVGRKARPKDVSVLIIKRPLAPPAS